MRDPDIAASAGFLARAHTRLGRLAIVTKLRFTPRVSLGVRLLATNAAGEVLLVRHTYMSGLFLPGGAVDPGESCRDAAVREAAEETGLTLESPPRMFHVYFNRALGNRDHIVLYIATGVRPPPSPIRTAEILGSGFHAPDSLPVDVTPATQARIAEVLHGAAPSDNW